MARMGKCTTNVTNETRYSAHVESYDFPAYLLRVYRPLPPNHGVPQSTRYQYSYPSHRIPSDPLPPTACKTPISFRRHPLRRGYDTIIRNGGVPFTARTLPHACPSTCATGDAIRMHSVLNIFQTLVSGEEKKWRI
jgi:hypothetical protein